MKRVEGDTVWKRARANRVAFLVDGSAYYEALSAALDCARSCVMVLGWDLHSAVDLTPGGDGISAVLERRLAEVVAEHAELQVFIGVWKPPWPYRLDRQWFTGWHLRRAIGERLRFATFPGSSPGASHHHKLVLIDDQLAFVGGIDLTGRRWDSCEHPIALDARTDPWGSVYEPWHDVQVLVSGDLAQALAEYGRAFWQSMTGERLAPCPGKSESWPACVAVDVKDVDAGIVRTVGADADADGGTVRETERCYRELIASAHRWIYLENQFFAAPGIVEWIEARLDEPDGPEIVLVAPGSCEGWLDAVVMGSKRAHFLRRLRQHPAAAARLRVYQPLRRCDSGWQAIFVHAKLAIVDRTYALVGSANLSNRSFGLDTELSVVLETGAPRHDAPATELLERLLAEHLGTTPEVVADRIDRGGSLIGAIEGLRGAARTLEPIDDAEAKIDLEAANALDPERPISISTLVSRLLSVPGGRRKRMIACAVSIAALMAICAGALLATAL